MAIIHHINCGTLRVPGYPTVACHCLLLEDSNGLTLVDTGIGLLDVKYPAERLGQPLIDAAGFQFNEFDTAVRRLENLGFAADDVRNIVLTHGDPDHAGGLADFPDANVHVSAEELTQIRSGHWRYVSSQFQHGPNWKTYQPHRRDWFGLRARPIQLGLDSEVLLIPLFGHTLGHCGVAVQQKDGWLLHVGDAYYLRAELFDDRHPVSAIAASRADADEMRKSSLEELRRLYHQHGDEIEFVGFHDISEYTTMPSGLN